MKTLLEFDYKKAIQAVNYLAEKEGGKIDKLKVIKLIYLADRYHLRKYGRPIINDTYVAMDYGPVGSSIKDIVGNTDYLGREEVKYSEKYLIPRPRLNLVVSKADVDDDVFSDSDIEALDYIYKKFGRYKASTLVDISHKYYEWKKFEKAITSKDVTREYMSYSDFFDNTVKDELDLSDDDIEASKEVFNDSYKIAQYWN